MKNPILFLFALIAALSACNQAPKQPTFGPPKNHLRGYPDASEIVHTYTQYLRSLDTLDLSTSQLAQNQFDTLFAAQLPQVCDTGFMLYWNYLQILNTQDSQKKLQANNFVVKEEEGGSGPFLSPSWELVSHHFAKFVSAPMKEVFAQETMGEKQPFLNDDAVIIDPSNLVHRTIWWEQFLAGYPHHIYDSTARSNFNVLVYVMIAGVDNTPVASFDSTQKIDPFYSSVYQLLRDSFPNSHATAVIIPWWQALLANDTITIKKIRDTIPLY